MDGTANLKICVLDAQTTSENASIWDFLKSFGEVEIWPTTAYEEVPGRVSDADIVLTNKVPLGEREFEAAKRLKFVSVLATGYNIIDLEAARRHNVVVSNVPAYSTDSVAQMTFALLLALASGIPAHVEAVRKGRWAECGQFTFRLGHLTELAGKRLGIIGFGAIGRKVASIAQAFGMEVVTDSGRELSQGVTRLSRSELLRTSDVVSLHTALTPERMHMIDAQALAMMKPEAFLINTARGALIDETALAEALKQKRIAGAALDVLTDEPPAADNPLIGLPQCIITPHIAWQTDEAITRLLGITSANIEAFIGGDPINTVS